jgi:PadR family transcriptional regulator, regulatory protein PadR
VPPFREPTFLILVALADGEQYGYGIIQEIESLSQGSVRLGAGTLYGALDRLADEGLVEATRQEVVDGRHRRYYRLTDRGLGAIQTETQRRLAMATAASRKLRGQPGGALA